MKRLMLVLLLPLICAWPSANMGGGVPAASGGGFTDCATDGASMDYCQDFEEPGGGNPSGETPAMDSDLNDTNADYATSPAPLDGAQSGRRGSSGVLRDTTAHADITGQGWWQVVAHMASAPADFQPFMRARDASANASPFVLFSSVSGSNFKFHLFCDDTFAGGTNVASTTTFSTGNTYLVKWEWNHADGTGELFVCTYSGDPFASCTTSEGTCNGADAPAGVPDGFLFENNPVIVDDIFISDTDLSP